MNQRSLLKFLLPIVVIMGLFLAGALQWHLHHDKGEDLTVLLQKCPVKHLGIIMDGNRRWAKQRDFKPWLGHRYGLENLRMSVKFCSKYHIPYLTVYAFSLENLKRPTEELNFLFGEVMQEVFDKDADELSEKGVRVKFIGDRAQFPERTVKLIEGIEQKTAHNNDVILSILLCYGGQQEIVAAAKSLCREIIVKNESVDLITADRFENHLWSKDLPPVDVIVRTGFVSRLSNFLLYKVAYSDLYFVDCFWPDITEQRLEQVIRDFIASEHRFFGA
jgi:undecaprenyl diphosphate synthase